MPPLKYAVRLRASYETLRTTVAAWALRCEKVLCYQHEDRAENIHCHLLLEAVYDSVDTLKRDMRQHGIDLKGAGQLSFKTTYKMKDGTQMIISDATVPTYITYMSKGKYDPSYNKGYDPEFIAARKAAWVVHSSPDPVEDTHRDFETYVCKALTAPQYAIYEHTGPNKDLIRSLSFSYVFELRKRQWNRGTRNQWSDVYTTYCLRNNLIGQLNIPMV